MLYQTARCAGYSPVMRLPFTSCTVLIGESLRTSSPTSSGEPRITSRTLGACGKGLRPPIWNFGPRYESPMSTALTMPSSTSPVFSSGRNVLLPAYGWIETWNGPPLMTLARPLPNV